MSRPKLSWGARVAAVLVLLASALVLAGLVRQPVTGSERFAPEVSTTDLDQARAALGGLEIVGSWPEAPDYDRDDYQPSGWADEDGDCLDTRQEMLVNESLTKVAMAENGCEVETGEWVDPYTGRRFTDPSQLDIDHVVALSAAHDAGAWKLLAADREAFANDLSNRGVALAVVETSINQKKGDKAPDAWMPPKAGARCLYAIRWITVKHVWGLLASPAEADALGQALDGCEVEASAE